MVYVSYYVKLADLMGTSFNYKKVQANPFLGVGFTPSDVCLLFFITHAVLL